ncbi:MAG: sulfur carrier protein ThiS [Rickettsiaceae bacterium H1]|nr:sulfur carrier protein ThiS [Rickettsiaceae bacterium H1]
MVNGSELLLEKAISITKLIEMISCDVTKVAIEQNTVIIPRSEYNSTIVKEGDKIECVEFVGGG